MGKAHTKVYWLTLLSIIFFFVMVGITLKDNEPWSMGDGYEYILQTASVQNHATFGYTADDLKLAQEQFYHEADMLEVVYDKMAEGSNNLKYSNHFGMYSLLVTFVKLVLLRLEIYPIFAFRITNLILWLSAILTVFFCLKVDEKKKLGLILLLLFNPVFFYVTWVHTEVWLFSFCVIGLVFYYNKEYAKGIFFVSVAAMQNLGIIPLAMVMGIDYIIKTYSGINFTDTSYKGLLKIFLVKIVPYGVFFVPAVLPMITCYMHFGVLNRVVEVARENKYLLSKAEAYLTDLNLGILPYEPIVLIAFLAMIIYGMYRKKKAAWLNFLAIVGMLYIIANQKQINCGMEGIMRYNVWILPVMIFYTVLNMAMVDKKACIFICFEAIFTTFMVVYTIWGSPNYKRELNRELQFTPWAKTIMNNYPEIYNPFHTIFYSRVCGEQKHDSNKPTVYITPDGKARKILLSKQAEPVFYSEACILTDGMKKIVDKNTIKRKRIDQGDYHYLNLKGDIYYARRYNLGNTISLYQDDYNADEYIISGISQGEDWGSWTDGERLFMNLYIPDNKLMYKGELDVVRNFYHSQRMIILINDETVYDSVIESPQKVTFSFENNNLGIYRVEIHLPDAVRPTDVMESQDSRRLGVGLRAVTIDGCD